jgi:hypothetical protein
MLAPREISGGLFETLIEASDVLSHQGFQPALGCSRHNIVIARPSDVANFPQGAN